MPNTLDLIKFGMKNWLRACTLLARIDDLIKYANERPPCIVPMLDVVMLGCNCQQFQDLVTTADVYLKMHYA